MLTRRSAAMGGRIASVAAPKNVCVFCSSSDAVEAAFFEAAAELGALLARRNYSLLYGGAQVGLMGALAGAVHREGGHVIGVIPQAIHRQGVAYLAADELIVTQDLRERKTVMNDRSDAFLALPGGFGTLEEFLEILTLRQLGYHDKPLVLLNTQDFFEPLLQLFEHLYRSQFAKPEYRSLYHVAGSPAAALDHLESYQPTATPSKWFEPGV